jgi:hypothetical protein
MQSRRKLRFRLIVSFALFGFGLSALFAVAALYVRAKVENQLINDSLQNDTDQAVDQIIAHPDQQAHSELLEAWFKSDRTIYKMPLAWQDLGTGVHDIQETDTSGKARHYKLAVRRKNGIIGFTRYDISREDLGKRQLITSLIGAVIIFSLLSLALACGSRAKFSNLSLNSRIACAVFARPARPSHWQCISPMTKWASWRMRWTNTPNDLPRWSSAIANSIPT